MALPVNGSTHLIPAYYSFYRPRKDERLSWPSWLTYSGWFTHISGHPSAAGRAQDRESSPARDRRSTTVLRHQLALTCVKMCAAIYGHYTGPSVLAGLLKYSSGITHSISIPVVCICHWLLSNTIYRADFSSPECPYCCPADSLNCTSVHIFLLSLWIREVAANHRAAVKHC